MNADERRWREAEASRPRVCPLSELAPIDGHRSETRLD